MLPVPVAQLSSSAPFESVALHCGVVACGAQDGTISFASLPRGGAVQGTLPAAATPAVPHAATTNAAPSPATPPVVQPGSTGRPDTCERLADRAGNAGGAYSLADNGGASDALVGEVKPLMPTGETGQADKEKPVRVGSTGALALLEGVAMMMGHSDWVTHLQIVTHADLPAALPAPPPSDVAHHALTSRYGAGNEQHDGIGGEIGIDDGSCSGSASPTGRSSDGAAALERHARASVDDAAQRAGSSGVISRFELLISASRDHSVRPTNPQPNHQPSSCPKPQPQPSSCPKPNPNPHPHLNPGPTPNYTREGLVASLLDAS